MIRRHYVFSGHVQHVGFRWRAGRAAGMLSCTGWCRNNKDGSVTMEIQGSGLKIALVILALRCSRRIHIMKTDTTQIPVVPGETEFLSLY